MSGILERLKTIFLVFGGMLALLFLMQMANTAYTFYLLSSDINPSLGRGVLVGMLVLYAAILFIPLAYFFRREIMLVPPLDASSEEYKIYLSKISKRLSKNKHLSAHISTNPIDRVDGIGSAYAVLDKMADKAIKDAASIVFVSTGVSQSGRLDGLMVLMAQIRLISQIASIYNQQPSISDLAKLYMNVFATAFVAESIEDLDIEEQVGPIVSNLLESSAISAIPGAGQVANLFASSILEATANAFLTLRVGHITKASFNPFVALPKNKIKKIARAHAAWQLDDVVKAGTSKIGVTLKTAACSMFGNGKKSLSAMGDALLNSVKKIPSKASSMIGRSNPSV